MRVHISKGNHLINANKSFKFSLNFEIICEISYNGEGEKISDNLRSFIRCMGRKKNSALLKKKKRN